MESVNNMLNDLAITPMSGIFSSGRIDNMPDDNERMALSAVAPLLGCSTVVLSVAAKNGVLPTAKKIGPVWSVEFGAARDWWNREKHAGGRPKKTNI